MLRVAVLRRDPRAGRSQGWGLSSALAGREEGQEPMVVVTRAPSPPRPSGSPAFLPAR